MISWLHRVWGWLVGAELVDPAPAVVEAAPDPRPVRAPRKSADHYGAHYYLGDLLDRLDGTFADFALLKSADPEAFGLYSRLGASVMSSDVLISARVEPIIKATLPAFSCAYLGRSAPVPEPGKIHPSFLFFVRDTAKPFVFDGKTRALIEPSPSDHAIYRVGGVYHVDGRSSCLWHWVSVSPDGRVRALRMRRRELVEARHHRRGAGMGRHGQGGFNRIVWKLPDHVMESARDHAETPDRFAETVFAILASVALQREAGIEVRVQRDKFKATFSIDMLRTPYFFANREKVVNVNGRTRPILHLVRGHVRESGAFIKPHFRGLRAFAWNGYAVSIGMPGRHYASTAAFDLVPHSPEESNAESLDLAEVAERLDQNMTEGF